MTVASSLLPPSDLTYIVAMKKKLTLRCVLYAFGILWACSAPAASDEAVADILRRRVESGLTPFAATKDNMDARATIADRMRSYGVPGLSIAVIDNGRIVWARGYGTADSLSHRPVTRRTLFQAASISKPISALGVLLLLQKGQLDIDENVNDKLKSWAVPDTDLTRAQPVTPRMLLNHTAGVTHVHYELDDSFSTGENLPTIVQILKGEEPARRGSVRVARLPGTQFDYSGAGYEILQLLAMDVSGRSFESYMQSEVLRPLGMTDSTFGQPLPTARRAEAALGHYAGGDQVPGGFRVAPELTVAGLWTTPTDVARYILNVQRAIAGANGGPLSTGLAQQMVTPGLGNRGLGPAISGIGATARFGHDGFNEGYESSFVGYIHEGRGAVVMANSGFAFMLIKEVLGSISRVYEWPDYGPTTQQPPDADIHQQQVIPVSRDILVAAPGEYAMPQGLTMKIYSRGRRLFLDWPQNGIAEVFATSDGRFFCPQLTFSELGSPWLQVIEDRHRVVTSIKSSDEGGVEFRRVR
jgi:CubicO group peptidase (beta-lactamase class C family)